MSSTQAKLRERIVVKNYDQDGNLRPVGVLDNDSLRPTPVKDRSWTQLTYTIFWFSATANVSNLYNASTGMSAGLSMWEALACQTAGQFVAGLLMALNGRAGALYRIPFPVLCRASFGHFGALWPTFNRACMSIVWNGVNSVQGAQSLYVFLHAIFPSITKIPDIMGTKSALNSGQMLCFFIYWAINCAFLFVPVPRMKKLVYVKTAVFFIATIAYVIWMSQVGGIDSSTLSQPSVSSGSGKKWLIIKFFFLGLASCGTFISNAADLQRYTRRPKDVLLGQIISFPVSNCLVGVLGNFIAVATTSAFGKFEWNPLTTLDNLMAGDRYNSRNRAGCAFISLAYVYSTIFSAIFENSIPAGNDIAALAPKYITVKRGFFICAVLSFAICPWYLLSTASVFITFLSSYQIFLSAITGILVCDYYLLRRGYLRVDDLYRTNPEGPYAFLKGFNLRAFAIYIIAVAPNFYGFLHQLGVHAGVKVEKAYCFAYPIGLLLAFGGFFAINRIFPVDSSTKATGWQEPKEHVDTFDSSDVLGVLEGQPVETSIVTDEKHGEKQSPNVVTASRFD